jgi:hypothetical protein
MMPHCGSYFQNGFSGKHNYVNDYYNYNDYYNVSDSDYSANKFFPYYSKILSLPGCAFVSMSARLLWVGSYVKETAPEAVLE